jgi:hypothetical protein
MSNELQPGQKARDDLVMTETVQVAETASAAVAAQAQAAIQARYVMAVRRPRDLDDVRQKLLKECKRSTFAAVARYHKPIGQNGVTGPSIRFAEAAIRHLGNIDSETTTIYDDPYKRIVRVAVTDLESNDTYRKDVVITKTVERKKLRQGQSAVGSRTNSYGDNVYIVEATDDDLLNKENALISKALRTNALRLVPGDLLEECMDAVVRTVKSGVEADPDAERNKIADAFGEIGVKASELKAYLGHPLEGSSPAELVELRALYSAIRDGEATWNEAMDSKHATPESEEGEPDPKREKLREKLAGKKEKIANGNGGKKESAP